MNPLPPIPSVSDRHKHWGKKKKKAIKRVFGSGRLIADGLNVALEGPVACQERLELILRGKIATPLI